MCRIKCSCVNFSMRNLCRTASDFDLEEKKSESRLKLCSLRETDEFENKRSGISLGLGVVEFKLRIYQCNFNFCFLNGH